MLAIWIVVTLLGTFVAILSFALMGCCAKVSEMVYILQAFKEKIEQLDDRQGIQNERINNINMVLKDKLD